MFLRLQRDIVRRTLEENTGREVHPNEVVMLARWDDTVDELLEAYLEQCGLPVERASGLLFARCEALPEGLPPEAGYLAVLVPLTKLRAGIHEGEKLKVLPAEGMQRLLLPPEQLQRVREVHYLNREAQLEEPSVDDPFREVTLFKRNPLEGGPEFLAYKDGKAAVSVAAAAACDARPGGSLSFAGFGPGRSRTFDPELACVLHYPHSSCEQFERKYAWRVQEKWNNHPFHRRCLAAAAADAAAVEEGGVTATATLELFREVLGTEAQRQEGLRSGLNVRERRVRESLLTRPQ